LRLPNRYRTKSSLATAVRHRRLQRRASGACVRVRTWAKFSRPYGTEFVNPASHADTEAPEVRFSNCLWLRPIGVEKRTSVAKAVKRQAIYGTAEAVPFVKSLVPIWLKPSPTLKSCPDTKHQSRDSGKTRATPLRPAYCRSRLVMLTRKSGLAFSAGSMA
jgi:hypothetical protein